MLFAIQRDASVPVKGSLVYLVCDLMKLVGPFGGHSPCDHHAAVDEAEFDLRGPSGDTLQFTEHSEPPPHRAADPLVVSRPILQLDQLPGDVGTAEHSRMRQRQGVRR